MAGLQDSQTQAVVPAGARPRLLPLARVEAANRRVLAAHVAALLGTAVVLLVDSAPQRLEAAFGIGMFVAIAGLRVTHVRRKLAVSTIVLDATGTAVFMAGTGAPASPFFFLALAGAWWAAHLPRPHTGAMWGTAFVVVYSILVMPGAIADQMLVHALEDAAVIAIVGVLADWFVRVDGRAIALSDALAKAPAGADKLAIRDGLSRALGAMEISLDVLMAASRAGLTVIQAELLAYIALGLTNQEIADATKVSVPTVRYRLTRLYRALGVSGRKAAAARAQQMGLAAAVSDD